MAVNYPKLGSLQFTVSEQFDQSPFSITVIKNTEQKRAKKGKVHFSLQYKDYSSSWLEDTAAVAARMKVCHTAKAEHVC